MSPVWAASNAEGQATRRAEASLFFITRRIASHGFGGCPPRRGREPMAGARGPSARGCETPVWVATDRFVGAGHRLGDAPHPFADAHPRFADAAHGWIDSPD